MRPFTAEIKNNNLIPSNSVIRDKKNILPHNIHKKKIGVNLNVWKARKNGAECIRGMKI